MNKRINTSKTLHNSYFEGDKYDLTFNNSTPMQVSPLMSEQYDFALTDNPELLNDRKATAELIYEIYQGSVYNDGRFDVKDGDGGFKMKIPKPMISEVFTFVKDEILKVKQVSPIELVIAINEFFDFNYEYVYKKVLTPRMKQDLIEWLRQHTNQP